MAAIVRQASDRLAEATEIMIRGAIAEFPQIREEDWRIIHPTSGGRRELQIWSLGIWHTVRLLPTVEIHPIPGGIFVIPRMERSMPAPPEK